MKSLLRRCVINTDVSGYHRTLEIGYTDLVFKVWVAASSRRKVERARNGEATGYEKTTHGSNRFDRLEGRGVSTAANSDALPSKCDIYTTTTGCRRAGVERTRGLD